jgi:hypothetical protein
VKYRVLCTVMGLLIAAQLARSQTSDQNSIDSASLTAFAPPNFYLDVHFTNRLSNPVADLTVANVTITTTPAVLAPPLQIGAVALLPGSRKSARINFSSGLPAAVSSMQVCFGSLTLIESNGSTKAVSNLCSTVQILNSSTVVAAQQALLKDLETVPKTSAQKNIFASGFVTTASSGTQGGLNLDLNSNQLGIQGMTAFLRTNKTSTPGGDPKNFEVGTNFSNAYTFGRSEFQAIRSDIQKLQANPSDTSASTDINQQQQKVQKQILSAVIVDMAGKLEGEGTNFNVANYVGDAQVSLQSRTQELFGSRKGFWKFRFVPFGFEGGKNVESSTTTSTGTSSAMSSSSQSEDFVARYKGGGTFTLFYDDPESLLPFKRIDLELDTVHRYLFHKESELLSANATPVLRQGYRPWYEANLLVYVAESQNGRYGFKLTYNNGSLPPSFAITKSFNFGFVYETSDGEQTVQSKK